MDFPTYALDILSKRKQKIKLVSDGGFGKTTAFLEIYRRALAKPRFCEEKRVFTMGGAYSADRYMREVHESYLEEEMPTGEEYSAAYSNLQRHSMSVDIILTHTAPTNAILSLGDAPHQNEAELTDFLDKFDNEVEYGRWYFGHLDTDKSVSENFSSLYFRCVDP